MKVPGARVIHDHQLATLLHVMVQGADEGIVGLPVNLVGDDQSA